MEPWKVWIGTGALSAFILGSTVIRIKAQGDDLYPVTMPASTALPGATAMTEQNIQQQWDGGSAASSYCGYFAPTSVRRFTSFEPLSRPASGVSLPLTPEDTVTWMAPVEGDPGEVNATQFTDSSIANQQDAMDAMDATMRYANYMLAAGRQMQQMAESDYTQTLANRDIISNMTVDLSDNVSDDLRLLAESDNSNKQPMLDGMVAYLEADGMDNAPPINFNLSQGGNMMANWLTNTAVIQNEYLNFSGEAAPAMDSYGQENMPPTAQDNLALDQVKVMRAQLAESQAQVEQDIILQVANQRALMELTERTIQEQYR